MKEKFSFFSSFEIKDDNHQFINVDYYNNSNKTINDDAVKLKEESERLSLYKDHDELTVIADQCPNLCNII